MGTDSDNDRSKGNSRPSAERLRRDSASLGAHDVAILPAGVLDPVYDAKARVLNRAVSLHYRHTTMLT